MFSDHILYITWSENIKIKCSFTQIALPLDPSSTVRPTVESWLVKTDRQRDRQTDWQAEQRLTFGLTYEMMESKQEAKKTFIKDRVTYKFAPVEFLLS